jgi:AraC family transcriptional regulator of arabinose operon
VELSISLIAEKIYDPAMAKRTDDIHHPVADITAGYFNEDKRYRTRRAKGAGDYLIVLTVGGRGRLRVPGKERFVGVGDLFVYEPGGHQDYGTDATTGKWELRWSHFQPRPNWHALLDWPTWWPGLRGISLGDGGLFDEVAHAFGDAQRFCRLPLPHSRALASNALERALLLADQANPNASRRQIDERVRRAMDYLCDRMTEKLTLNEVAKAASLSPSRLSHIFVEQVGLSPMRFLEQQRIAQAKLLLKHTAQPIQTIADRVGFESPYYFSLRFKKAAGVSPRAYRKGG